MGQFRAVICPVCDSPDIPSKWTCASCTALVGVHKELIRSLQSWRGFYEAGRAPETLISGSTGEAYSLWDVERFYDQRTRLPERMSESIQFFLFENMKEEDVAIRMGIAKTNPIGIYATIGVTTLLRMAIDGELPGYRLSLEEDQWIDAR